MCSTYNEGKFAVAERFIRILKNKILKHMTVVSKNVYFDIVDKYNKTYHRTIKIKPVNVKPDFSKYKSIFAQGYAPNWS